MPEPAARRHGFNRFKRSSPVFIVETSRRAKDLTFLRLASATPLPHDVAL